LFYNLVKLTVEEIGKMKTFVFLSSALIVLIFAHQSTSQQQQPPKCTTLLDLGIILDASGSIGEAAYNQARQAIKTLVQSLNVSQGKIHFGLINYSSSSAIVQGFIPTEQVKSLITQKIDKMVYAGGGTATANALLTARTKLFSTRRGQETPRIALIFTDGASNEGLAAVKSESDQLKNEGIELFSIGIGTGIKQDELNAMASFQQNVMLITNYNALVNSINAITLKACEANAIVPLNKEVETKAIEPQELRYFVTKTETVDPKIQYVEIGVTEKKGAVNVYYSTDVKNPNSQNSMRAVPSRSFISRNGEPNHIYIIPFEKKETNLFYSIEGIEKDNDASLKVQVLKF
jgi:hypothetical protein